MSFNLQQEGHKVEITLCPCMFSVENFLHVQILYVQRVVFDKLPTRFDLVAH